MIQVVRLIAYLLIDSCGCAILLIAKQFLVCRNCQNYFFSGRELFDVVSQVSKTNGSDNRHVGEGGRNFVIVICTAELY